MIKIKVINVQDISKYPDNYDNLSNSDKVKILSYMNGMDNLAMRYFNKSYTANDYFKLYQHTLTGLIGAKNAYATLGIMVERWGNPIKGEEKWILATKEDAEKQANSTDSVETAIEEIVKLLSYGDIQ